MNNCKLPFHIQVASKGFLPILTKLAKFPDTAPEVKEKIINFIQDWAIKFQKQSDVLPLLQECYTELKKSGLKFSTPSLSDPKLKIQPKYNPEPLPRQEIPVPQNNDQFDKNDKFYKLRQSWKILVENMKLANVFFS